MVLELRQIKYFMEVARTLNFSRAAEELFISQPTLSQQIALLEDELKAKLFERNRRTVKLTRAGQIFLDYSVRMCGLLDEARDKIRISVDGDFERPFIIGLDESTPNLDKQGFFSAIDTFQAANPDFPPSLKALPYKDILPALQSGEIDVCVTILMRDELENFPCELRILGSQRIVLCVPHAFAAQYSDNWECICQASKKLDLLLLSNDLHWATNFHRFYSRSGLPYNPTYISSYNSICTYVEAGRGAMLDTESNINSERERFSTAVPFPAELGDAVIVLLWNRATAHPMLDDFLNGFDRPEGEPSIL